ncbi:HalOD1 output domain-containing protein [Halovivax gelatinilyticus]|uniref:HalOD1 output domain-containing protein n=1 Tax=Halovivax gelatinilyticus TaxID=2961597 RepID=UPI0020CA58F8|nr:HalOD1 output domain-containing protein [Halovivax gelatinilyticus]
MRAIHADEVGESSVTQTVVESVAEAEGIDPLELSPPLYDVVDTEALETLFADKKGLGKIIFNYKTFEVSVFSDGYVSIVDNGTQVS